jgi:hypothetical protein
MDLMRIIVVYVLQLGIGGIFFLFIAALILKRSRKKLNIVFSMFFISVALGIIINVIYASITYEELIGVVIFLHILTFYLFTLAQVFLLTFNLILLKSEAIFSTLKQILLVIIYAILLSILFLVGMFGGVELGPSTDWKPVWYLPFLLTVLGICVPTLIIPILYFSLQIYSKFENEELKEKWKYFLIGILLYFIMWAGTTITNFLAQQSIRNIWAIFSFASLLSTYTIYYGVGKEIN